MFIEILVKIFGPRKILFLIKILTKFGLLSKFLVNTNLIFDQNIRLKYFVKILAHNLWSEFLLKRVINLNELEIVAGSQNKYYFVAQINENLFFCQKM